MSISGLLRDGNISIPYLCKTAIEKKEPSRPLPHIGFSLQEKYPDTLSVKA